MASISLSVNNWLTRFTRMALVTGSVLWSRTCSSAGIWRSGISLSATYQGQYSEYSSSSSERKREEFEDKLVFLLDLMLQLVRGSQLLCVRGAGRVSPSSHCRRPRHHCLHPQRHPHCPLHARLHCLHPAHPDCDKVPAWPGLRDCDEDFRRAEVQRWRLLKGEQPSHSLQSFLLMLRILEVPWV